MTFIGLRGAAANLAELTSSPQVTGREPNLKPPPPPPPCPLLRLLRATASKMHFKKRGQITALITTRLQFKRRLEQELLEQDLQTNADTSARLVVLCFFLNC